MFFKSKPTAEAVSYIGVAASQYGVPFDIDGLCNGKFDKSFCDSELYFKITCTIFSDKKSAISRTARRAVLDNSAYVLTLSCSKDEIEAKMKTQGLSNLISEVTNAVTGKQHPISLVDNSQKNLI